MVDMCECGIPLDDIEDENGAVAHLHCDFCDIVEHADDLTPDWNGETGCHLSCEYTEKREWCWWCGHPHGKNAQCYDCLLGCELSEPDVDFIYDEMKEDM